MKLIRTTTLLTCCIALSPVPAQERSAQQLHLKTGVYDCPNNLEAFIDLPYRADELRKGAYYRIIQFNELPTPKEQREMAEAGIELRSYVPSYAFQARIRSDASLNKLSHWGARSVMEIDPRFKMTQSLANRDFPAHALESNDHILLSVLYYPDFTAEEVIASLDQINARILGQFAERNQIELSVPINRWEEIAAMPEIFFIEAIDPTPEPENDRGRTNHRVNFYQNGSTQYGGFDGSGIVVAMGDDGRIGPHIDYRGRVDQRYASGSSGNHGDHVAGTIIGAGNYDPDGRGNAPGAYLFTYQPFRNADSSSSHYYSHQVRITSTSYSNGCNAGYTSYASFADQTIYDHPELMHVFSAGNEGIWTDCNYGAGPGWGNVTGGIKVGKNTIAVGNVLYNDILSNGSSRGPAEDGRIKPDVCAVGASVYSTVEGNSYATFSGTSMSCPGVTGVLATMYHAYKETNNGSEPTSDLMKGILMNTAEDLGNPGPDFRYGYGRVNARRAHKAITDQTFFRDSVAQGESDIFYVTVPAGIGELKVMLYWNDVEGTPAAQNPLVNNLQLVVTDPNNVDYNPWVLDHTPIVANLNAPAVRAVDSLNNAEQVTLDNPAAGSYTLSVSGATVPNGPQRYVLVYQYTPEDEIVLTFPNGGAALLPDSTEVVRWDALSNGTGFTLDYSDDDGTTWNSIGTAGANQRYKDWSVPGTLASDEVLVRVSRGSDSDQSDSANTALRRVENFQAPLICPDSIFFTWDPVPGAASYEIMHLDTAYMQIAGTVTDTFGAVLQHNTSVDHYYTIRAVGANGGKGERRDALFVSAGIQNCVLDHDIGLTLLSPFHGPNPGCGNTGQAEVAVRATNFGNNDVFGLSLTYGHDANTTVTEAFTDTLLAGESKELAFGQALIPNGSGTNALVVYRSDTLDQNLYNDTAKASFYFLSPGTATVSPWADNLESFTACNTASDCEATVCPLPGGWVNLPNGASDDIDWRANSGGTPSPGTGPDQDHDPGNSTGMYLYLEASGGCRYQEAILYSPCVILPLSPPIELTYHYHMEGVHQGELHTDLVVNGRLFEDVIPIVAGDQGSAWNLASVNLNAYSGDTVVVRLRGVTGPGARSDLALDDFRIEAVTSAPNAAFIAGASEGCPGTVIHFTNTSTGSPSAFSWHINPATGWNYVNGTSSTSQSISVQFTAPGNYTVGMTADNGVGVDSVGSVQPIVIGSQTLPFFEDFETPSGFDRFQVNNPDDDITWEHLAASGNCGSQAAGINNFLYSGAQNQEVEDWLTTPILDFTGTVGAHLTFDHAYARYSATLYDSMAVFISTDCGVTWIRLASYDGAPGGGFETVPDQNSDFSPVSATEWCGGGTACTDIDLSSYSGYTEVQIRWIAKSGYGNNLYIDNINISTPSSALSIITSATDACTGETVTFSDGSGNAFQNYNWDFGPGATPGTATGPGPHNVTYTVSGSKTVALSANNSNLASNAFACITITESATSSFSFVNPSAGTVNFFPDALPSEVDSVFWDFGDGNTSTIFLPTHTFTANGTYPVQLTVYSPCGSTTSTVIILIEGIGLEEWPAEVFDLFPQPAKDQVTLKYTGKTLNGEVTVRLVDAQGRIIRTEITNGADLRHGMTWWLNGLAAAWYQLQVVSATHFWHSPLIRQ